MTSATRRPVVNIDPARIVSRDRLRKPRPEVVEALAESIKAQGQLQPILVTRSGPDFVLIAGGHRLQAVRKLGHDIIRAEIADDLDADQALLIEIDENLVRADLTPAERALHHSERKRLYEKVHPQTKHGGDRRSVGSSSQNENLKAFVADTAEKTGTGRSTVARDVTRAKKVAVLGEIAGTCLDKGTEIDALAELSEAEQRELADRAKAGEKVTAKHVGKKLRQKKQLPISVTVTETPTPEPKPISVTSTVVTESAEISIEERKAQHANLDSEEPSTKASAEAQRSDTNKDAPDPLVLDRGDEIEATPWFSSKIKPIFDGSVKNDEVKSALALAEFKRTCATFLPQLTIKDLQEAQYIFDVISDLKYDVEHAQSVAKHAAADAKRIKWEASHPEEAKSKAREQAQHNAMEYEIEDAKVEARENGERWGDVKDEWVDQWVADNWGAEEEAQFEKNFQEQWAREHGVTHELRREVSHG